MHDFKFQPCTGPNLLPFMRFYINFMLGGMEVEGWEWKTTFPKPCLNAGWEIEIPTMATGTHHAILCRDGASDQLKVTVQTVRVNRTLDAYCLSHNNLLNEELYVGDIKKKKSSGPITPLVVLLISASLYRFNVVPAFSEASLHGWDWISDSSALLCVIGHCSKVI